MTLGYIVRRGYYSADRPPGVQPGPARWRVLVRQRRQLARNGGLDPRRGAGLLFANYPPLIEGPFRNAAGGVDISLPVAIGVAAVLYLAMLFVVPEPRYVFGPDGPRWVPAADGEMTPIIDDPRASAHRAGRRSELTPDKEPVN